MSVEFIKDTHTYLVDGIVVPSVSKILRETIFADKYKNIPEKILKRAAKYGTEMHEAIEHDNDSKLDKKQKKSFLEWKNLQKEYNIKPLRQETIVHYGLDYAGTFDMIAVLLGEEALIDIKTTAKLDVSYLSWQLSMYAYAYGFDGDLFAVWLPKREKARVVAIPRIEESQILKLLEAYYALSENGTEIQL